MPEPTFDEILSRLSAALPATEAETPMVAEAVRAFRSKLRDVDNLGETGDARDVLTHLEALTAAVKGCQPTSLCTAGCSACCDSETAVFDVSPAEWRMIEKHMRTAWTPAQREAFEARFAKEHAPRLGAYRWLSAIRFFEPVSDRHFAKHLYRCPFLEDGRCSVYAARPLACRMYGFYAVRSKWYQAPGVYACNDQAARLRQARPEAPLALPSVNMVVAGVKRLLRGPKRILPLWIAKRGGSITEDQASLG